jgi:hypothetical protein
MSVPATYDHSETPQVAHTMDDLERERLGTLLEAALALPPEERARFLEDSCGPDIALREELTSLLAGCDPSAGYFDGLAHDVVPALAAAVLVEQESGGALTRGDVVTHYEVVELIGGGMGVVYKARDLKLGRTVALKSQPPDRDSTRKRVPRQRWIIPTSVRSTKLARPSPAGCSSRWLGTRAER